MKSVIISYEVISPAVLAMKIEKLFNCFCSWKDIDEDFFEFTAWGCLQLASLEDALAQYV